MRTIIYLGILICNFWIASAVAQKKLITNDTYKEWERLISYNISPNGKWVWYVHNVDGVGDSLIVLSLDQKIRRVFFEGKKGIFTDDSRWFICMLPGDSVCIYDINTNAEKYIEGDYFQLSASEENPVLATVLKGVMTLQNLSNGKQVVQDILQPDKILFNQQGTAVLFINEYGLHLTNLSDFKDRIIFNLSEVKQIRFDNTGKRISILHKELGSYSLSYFNEKMDSARLLVNNTHYGISNEGFVLIDDLMEFSKNGRLIYFNLQMLNKELKKDKDLITDKLDVWSYTDLFIMSYQLASLHEFNNQKFTSIVDTETGAVLRLENDTTRLVTFFNEYGYPDKFVLTKNLTYEAEGYYNDLQRPKYKLVSLEKGFTKDIFHAKKNLLSITISPCEKFVVWHDRNELDYFSYEIKTGITRNLTARINVPADIGNMTEGLVTYRFKPRCTAWLEEDGGVIVGDKYDQWQLDLLSVNRPCNITGGYGRHNNIEFLGFNLSNGSIISMHGNFLLRAMNLTTMENGFWISKPGNSKGLKKIVMGPFFCSWIIRGPSSGEPLMAKKSNEILFSSERADSARNLYVIKDLQTCRKVSGIAPQRNYNWLSAELVRYPKNNSRVGMGVLYKPQDFDSSKKYPVIFLYYQDRVNTVHKFIEPSLSDNEINIPWYVSNGYLVFVPDILNLEPGRIALTAVDAVESAGRYLSRFNWVDELKFGLQGHSFGGYETTLIIANSKMFAAACAASAPTNPISMFGSVSFGGKAQPTALENGQFNFNVPLWERPDIYLQNAAVFKCHKIITPLLMLNNKKDGAVPFAQGVELFIALRRLEKPVWMLQYDDEGHTLASQENKLDFTVRMQQFYDHYLKGKPPPIWMTKGISADNKGIKSGLQLDIN